MKNEIVPENNKGKQVDLYEESELVSDAEAISTFNKAKDRLLNPSCWKSVTGSLAAEFRSADVVKDGEEDKLAVGDYIKIDIPAPGTTAGKGYDWVIVESMQEDYDPVMDESFAMTLKVCENPENPEKGIAHFFAEGASSTFIVTRKSLKVKASYHGRNETPNLDNPGLGDKVRNAVVAIGAMAGVSELQWQALLKGLLQNE